MCKLTVELNYFDSCLLRRIRESPDFASDFAGSKMVLVEQRNKNFLNTFKELYLTLSVEIFNRLLFDLDSLILKCYIIRNM